MIFMSTALALPVVRSRPTNAAAVLAGIAGPVATPLYRPLLLAEERSAMGTNSVTPYWPPPAVNPRMKAAGSPSWVVLAASVVTILVIGTAQLKLAMHKLSAIAPKTINE